jgi:uncharacterized damage-inducible protein DinB
MTRLRWFDRTFDFTFPAALHPEILERLRGTPGRLAERMSGIAEAVQTRRPAEGWSIREHVGHIADLDAGVFLWRVHAYRNGEATMPAADLTNAATSAAHHNARSMQEILEIARHARAVLVAELEALDEEVFTRTAVHPRLGVRMRLVDTMFFVAEHDDHHLATITELAGEERGR